MKYLDMTTEEQKAFWDEINSRHVPSLRKASSMLRNLNLETATVVADILDILPIKDHEDIEHVMSSHPGWELLHTIHWEGVYRGGEKKFTIHKIPVPRMMEDGIFDEITIKDKDTIKMKIDKTDITVLPAGEH